MDATKEYRKNGIRFCNPKQAPNAPATYVSASPIALDLEKIFPACANNSIAPAPTISPKIEFVNAWVSMCPAEKVLKINAMTAKAIAILQSTVCSFMSVADIIISAES